MAKLGTQMPVQANGKQTSMSWDELKTRLIANMVRNEYIEKIPDKKDLPGLGLTGAIDAYGGYYQVILRLKKEGVLSPKFDPLKRSLIKQAGMPEGPMKTTRPTVEPNPAARESLPSEREKSTPGPADENPARKERNGGPTKFNSKEECKQALGILFGKNARPDLDRLGAIVRAAKETPPGELDENERRELRLATALIRYASERPKAWDELREEYAQARNGRQARERREKAVRDAHESVRAALERIGGQPPKNEMPKNQLC